MIGGLNVSTSATRRASIQTLRDAQRRRQRLPRAPRMIWPGAAERGYRKALLAMVDAMRALTARILTPRLPAILANAAAYRPTADAARADSYVDEIEELIAALRAAFGTQYGEDELRAIAERAAAEIAASNAGQFEKVVKAVLKVDVFGSEPWLRQEAEAFVKSNVALIKSISERAFGEIETLVYDGARRGLRSEDIASQIQDRFGVSESRASLIADDQVGKFNGALNELRQTQAGVTRYVWRTVLDERVRDDHRVREGQVFSWDAPPWDGHPGQPIRCRCYSEPLLADILDDDGGDE